MNLRGWLCVPDDRAADLIEESDGQGALFEHSLPAGAHRSAALLQSRQVIDLSYQRCDQENVIEQFGYGIAGWRMPVAEFMGNSAWLEIARLAWNLGSGSLSSPCRARWCAGSGSDFAALFTSLPRY